LLQEQKQNRLITIDSRFTEEDTAINYFGEQLLAAGYNYYGNEPMYSGITGEEFAADIYIGVVYYQRLRHMVLDKFQVRTTGPVDPVTRQPVKVNFIFLS
jgi:DNA-directed RNA polymerase I subunit RPA2